MNLTKIKDIEQFQMMLNAPPKVVKSNALARGALYVPIATVEQTLDELYAGLWQDDNFHSYVVGNEIVGSIELSVYHPIAEMWLKRTGGASVQILVPAGKVAIIENKIKNALVPGFPNLKSMCLKNAAQSLGEVFGRNLNRKPDTISSGQKLSEKMELVIGIDSPILPKIIDAVKSGEWTLAKLLQVKKYTLTADALAKINKTI